MKNILKSVLGLIVICFFAIIYFDINIFPKGKNDDHDNYFLSNANKIDNKYMSNSLELMKYLGDDTLTGTTALKSKISPILLQMNNDLKELKRLELPINSGLKAISEDYIRQIEREISAYQRLIKAIDTSNVNLYNNSIDDIKDAETKITNDEHSLFD